MKLSKGFIFIISFFVVLGTLYGVLIFGVPAFLNSKFMVNKYENLASSKTGFPVKISSFKLKVNPDISFVVNADKILSQNETGVDVVNIQNIQYQSKRFSVVPYQVNIESIYADFTLIQNYIKTKDKNKEKKPLNLNYFPILNIGKIFVKLDKDSTVKITNIKSLKQADVVVCKFLGEVNTPYTKMPVVVGEDGFFYYSDNLYIDDLSVRFGESKLNISGEFENLDIFGKSLPVDELEQAFLFFYKIKHPGKKNFIENFHNLSGTLDVDLNLSKKGLNGKCIAHRLNADFSNFKFPVELPFVIFNFNGRKVWAKTTGTFGGEPVYTDFVVNGLGTKALVTEGNVQAKLGENFSKKYFKPVRIKGVADAKVKYHVQDGVVNIDYILGIDKGSNLLTSFGNIDNTDKFRQISAHTVKHGDKIFVQNYKYEFLGTNPEKILSGDGLFEKINGRFKPINAALKTNGDVSVGVIKSFIKDFLDGGTFNADIKYNFLNKTLLGYLNFNDTHHGDFLFLKKSNIMVNKDAIIINVDGTFFDSPIKLVLDADTRFQEGLFVNNIDIKLDKFLVKRGNITTVQSDFKHNSSKMPAKHNKNQRYKVEVKEGKIFVGEIVHSKFYLHDVVISGKLKDDVVEFIIPETEYAKGILSAVGKYNVVKHSSDIHFLASDIDSNEVATKIFKLPNQFEGHGYSTLHLITKNRLNDIHAHATFAISDGFLPKLGSREFIFNKPSKLKKVLFFIKKPIKLTLSKISNIDFSKPNIFYSNLRGSFILDNEQVDCVKIFSQSDNLSMFVEGDYNIDTQTGNLCIWGKSNKSADKKVRIFKIPLNWIYHALFKVERSKDMYLDKIKLIPPIKAKPSEEAIFRVYVNGNLNSNDIKVQMKDLR